MALSRYAAQVADVCGEGDGKVAAFFIESGMSVAGVIIPPKGYLPLAYDVSDTHAEHGIDFLCNCVQVAGAHSLPQSQAIRKAGGVCVADEVQTGFGRFGEYVDHSTALAPHPYTVTCGREGECGLH